MSQQKSSLTVLQHESDGGNGINNDIVENGSSNSNSNISNNNGNCEGMSDNSTTNNNNTSSGVITQYSDQNLIINYIPCNFSDEDLTNLFQSVGPIRNCRIIRDKVTHQTYGFGFCEFVEARHASEAIERFNGYNIANKQLKVAFARLPGQESKNCNLFVQNIPTIVSCEEIRGVFGKYGKIVECRRINDKEGNSRRISFVLFESRSCAEAAKEEVNGKPWPYAENVLKVANGNLDMSLIQVQFAAENSKKLKPMNNNRPSSSSLSHQGSSFGMPNNRFSGAENHNLHGNSNNNISFINNYLSNNASTLPQAHINQSQMYQLAMNQLLSRMRNMGPATAYANGYGPACVSNGASIMSSMHQGSVANSNNVYGSSNSQFSPPLTTNSSGGTLGGHFAYGQPLTNAHAVHQPQQQINAPNHPYFMKQNSSNSNGVSNNNNNHHGDNFVLYVYNTGNDMTEDKMRELFQGFGPIVKIDIPRESGGGGGGGPLASQLMLSGSRSKNFAFVTLADHGSAVGSINRLNGMLYFGKKLQVSFRKEKTGGGPGSNCNNVSGSAGGPVMMQKCMISNNNNNNSGSL